MTGIAKKMRFFFNRANWLGQKRVILLLIQKGVKYVIHC
jgi:hypothetical protein